MANYCTNIVTISTTDKNKLETLINNIVQNDCEYCNTILPTPAPLSKVVVSNKDYVIVDDNGVWLDVKREEESKYNKYYLTDEDKETLRKKYGFTNWYDWNNENRGSKWGVTITLFSENGVDDIEENDGVYSIVLRYDTANGTNLGVSSHLVKNGFNVHHKFWDEESDFAGVYFTTEDGEFVADWEGDCSFENKVLLDADLLNDYVSFTEEELKEINFKQVGELLVIDGEGIGVWYPDDKLHVLETGEDIDVIYWEHEGRIYFSPYHELPELCGWEN